MKQHKISWLNIPGYIPETWNPIIGCTKVSPGCTNCYAEVMARRIAGMKSYSIDDAVFQYREVYQWNGITRLVESQLEKPFKWRRPRAVFVCSMSDLFHENTPFEWIDDILGIIQANEQHLFIILTKRPERMKEYFYRDVTKGVFHTPMNNLWLSVTAENQEQADKRIPILLQIPAAKRVVSCEPLLGPINFHKEYPTGGGCFNYGELLDWVIVGGESGPKARRMDTEWPISIQRQCEQSGTPFFFKQWGSGIKSRLLNGQEYNEFPIIK